MDEFDHCPFCVKEIEDDVFFGSLLFVVVVVGFDGIEGEAIFSHFEGGKSCTTEAIFSNFDITEAGVFFIAGHNDIAVDGVGEEGGAFICSGFGEVEDGTDGALVSFCCLDNFVGDIFFYFAGVEVIGAGKGWEGVEDDEVEFMFFDGGADVVDIGKVGEGDVGDVEALGCEGELFDSFLSGNVGGFFAISFEVFEELDQPRSFACSWCSS